MVRYPPAFPKSPRPAALYLILASMLVGFAGFMVLRLGRAVFAELETVPPVLLSAGIKRPWLIAATALPGFLWGLLLLVKGPPRRGWPGFLLLLIPIAFTLCGFVAVITSLYSFEL